MEENPIRVCELLVGRPDVNVLGVDDEAGGPIRVHVESRGGRPVCSGCGTVPWLKDRRPVDLADLAAFGRRARLVWHKHPWQCAVLLVEKATMWVPRSHVTAQMERVGSKPRARLENRKRCPR